MSVIEVKNISKTFKVKLKEKGLKGIELNVYKTNSRAIHCYEKVGFIQDGAGKTEEDIHMIHKK